MKRCLRLNQERAPYPHNHCLDSKLGELWLMTTYAFSHCLFRGVMGS
uniref:Uncharacterized protein n=1 Tax=Anguilla anguilla TaxID=7936 RepID=A0A0E9V307_ANGAN